MSAVLVKMPPPALANKARNWRRTEGQNRLGLLGQQVEYSGAKQTGADNRHAHDSPSAETRHEGR
jgi:hypothetical protein